MFQSGLFFIFVNVLYVLHTFYLQSSYCYYHQVLISMWATSEAVGLLHFAMLVARLATFHDLLNLTPV